MLAHRPRSPPLILAHKPAVADDISGEGRGEAAGRGLCSVTPALSRTSRMSSSCARYVGLSLLVVQAARARETENSGLSVRPVLIAECASSNRPSRARAAANKNCGCGLLRLASIARLNHATACSQPPRCSFPRPALVIQTYARVSRGL